MAAVLTIAASRQKTPALCLYFKGLLDPEIQSSPAITCLKMDLASNFSMLVYEHKFLMTKTVSETLYTDPIFTWLISGHGFIPYGGRKSFKSQTDRFWVAKQRAYGEQTIVSWVLSSLM
jgi:hypothetical protein